MLSNTDTMILMINFEKAGGEGGGGGDQKRFLELPRAEARQLKILAHQRAVFSRPDVPGSGLKSGPPACGAWWAVRQNFFKTAY